MPPKAKRPAAGRSPAGWEVHYRVEAASLHAHLWRVTMTIAHPAAVQTLRLPVWIPGSYMVREFSKHLQNLQCRQNNRPLAASQTDKARWQVPCDPDQALQVQYEVYALDNSVRTSWLDSARGFFNATSLCLMAEGATDQAHAIDIVRHPDMQGWSVATGLHALEGDKAGFGRYQAADYDELADCPFELGAFWSGTFSACGLPHRLVVAGALPSFDGERLLRDTQKICETQLQFWHADGDLAAKHLADKAPFAHYVFLLNAVDDSYGGLEHRNSTALIAARRDLPGLNDAKTSDGYTTLLGLISHEYFHTWNVKRLRPAEFARYDYAQENYTALLWFFEGFTSYYDDLLLRRAGLIDDAGYFKLLTKTANQVLQTPGRAVQTVAQASFDAWVKYYRQDENTPNATVSYYTKGALVALCLDLSLRAEGAATLDAVMRGLWDRCAGGPMAEADLLAVLHALSGRSWAKEIKAWVHSTRELPLKNLLQAQGLQVHEDPAQMAQRLGLRVADANGTVLVKSVLRGGAAESAGFAAGDEWLGVEVGARGQGGSWRLNKLDDLALLVGTERRTTVLVSRDKRLLRLPLVLPVGETTWRIGNAGRPAGLWPVTQAAKPASTSP
ncbi:MAG: peptidase M61 [Rhodoferax sp.]|nr:peptidase M61 [Rhodoferax sp.]